MATNADRQRIAAGSYRITVYTNDAESRLVEEVQTTDVQMVGPAVVDALRTWHARRVDVRIVVTPWVPAAR